MIIEEEKLLFNVFFVILKQQDNAVYYYDGASISINFIFRYNISIIFTLENECLYMK
jgi:hypothetical protein